MENRSNFTGAAQKKSKKKKKSKKTVIQASNTELNSSEPSEKCEKQSVVCHHLPPNSETSNVSPFPGISTETAEAESSSSRKNNFWLHSCHKENSLNRAVEENHCNSLTETSTGVQDICTDISNNTEDCTDSCSTHQTVHKDTAPQTSVNKETVIVRDSVEERQEHTMPERQPQPDQKTKAQLKAERKAAFEAQQLSQDIQKPKATTKAERRALQEAQRTKKMATTQKSDSTTDAVQPTTGNSDASKSSKPIPHASSKSETEKSRALKSPEKIAEKKFSMKVITGPRKARLFSHLPQYQWHEDLTSEIMAIGVIHPAVIRIGLQIAQGLITGANARTVAMMLAFKQAIKDYTTPPQKELSRDLEAKLQPYIGFLNKCRPLSAGMENEVKKLKWEINHIPSSMSDAEAKVKLCKAIDTNMKNDIILAEIAIRDSICSKILHGDVILTYSCSSVVKGVLTYAHSEGRQFQVIVVDSRPRLEGREMVRFLAKVGIPCSYVLINAVSYVMKEVTKVILGAHSLQANGYVMSRVGSSQVALIARASNVPVLVCCETYKFSERVHTDSFVYNELGNPNDLVTTTPPHKCHLENWKEIPSLRLLNLAYDVTPPNLVTAVITDLGMLPCTSVPVVLRVKHVAGQEQ